MNEELDAQICKAVPPHADRPSLHQYTHTRSEGVTRRRCHLVVSISNVFAPQAKTMVSTADGRSRALQHVESCNEPARKPAALGRQRINIP